MDHIDSIYNTYYEIEKFIVDALDEHVDNQAYWYDIQEKTQMAFFVLLFAQFDGFIVNYLNENYGPEEFEDTKFMKKIGFLIDDAGSDYEDILTWYQIRCDIAHGRDFREKPGALKMICDRLKEIAGKVAAPGDFSFSNIDE